MKKRLLIILACVLLVAVAVSIFFTLSSRERRLNIPHKTTYSDFGALAKRKIQKLDSIPEISPKEKAEFINGIKNKKLFEFCVTETLDIYYGFDDKYLGEIEFFKENISSKADEIIKNYEAAAEERATGWDKGYSPTKVLVTFEYNTPYEDIAAIAENIGRGYEIIADSKDEELGICVIIDVDLDKTTKQTMDLLEKTPCVKHAERGRIGPEFSENVDEYFF